ncbi:MAG: hypothetical protein LBT70_00750, partial [Holosporaceae bacterium]|nr:hypothetical protein [Holosporaceae bacterium]
MKKSILMLSSLLFLSVCSCGFLAARDVLLPGAEAFKEAGVSESVVTRIVDKGTTLNRAAKNALLLKDDSDTAIDIVAKAVGGSDSRAVAELIVNVLNAQEVSGRERKPRSYRRNIGYRMKT